MKFAISIVPVEWLHKEFLSDYYEVTVRHQTGTTEDDFKFQYRQVLSAYIVDNETYLAREIRDMKKKIKRMVREHDTEEASQ